MQILHLFINESAISFISPLIMAPRRNSWNTRDRIRYRLGEDRLQGEPLSKARWSIFRMYSLIQNIPGADRSSLRGSGRCSESRFLRGGIPIGVIALLRGTVRPFTEKEIELVTTFADQAVIAIENVRLFDEVQARTGELARSVEELRALGEVSQAVNSTLDLETVLSTIVAKAVQLSNTDAGVIYVFDELDQTLRVRATYALIVDLVA